MRLLSLNMNSIYSPFLHHVIEFAAQSHKGQRRMHPYDTPYISHPFNVGILLLKAGYDDEIVAAGFLHDVIEDCEVTEDELEELFGKKVALMVQQVSEDKSIEDWGLRKSNYRYVLENAEIGSLAVAAADHLHNVKSLLMGMEDDREMQNKFHVSINQKIEHEKLCLEIFRKGLNNGLTKEFAEAVKELQEKITL